jgi:MFS family permease
MAMTAQEEWRAHWKIVLGGGLAFATGYAALSPVSSLFIDAAGKDLGLSRGTISLFSALGLLGAVSAPFIGRLADRYGVKRVGAVCFAALALIYAAQGLQDGSKPVFLALMIAFALFGVGTGALTITRAINSWFETSRGLALSVALASVSFFSLGLAPLLGHVIETWGWRHGYFVLAGLAGFAGLPAILLFVTERHAHPKPVAALPTTYPGQKLGQVWKTKDFICLATALFIMNVPSAGIVSQLSPMMTDKGFTLSDSALLISCMTGAVLCGRLLSGWLLDRVNPVLVGVVFTALRIRRALAWRLWLSPSWACNKAQS